MGTMNQRNQPQPKEPNQMAIEIYAEREEVEEEVETTETDEVQECNTIAPEEVEPTDAPEASSQEEETGEVEPPPSLGATIGPVNADIITQISNQELRCKRAEWVVIEKKEALKEAKEEYEGCIAELRRLCSQLQNDAPENRPLFSNLEAKVEEAFTPEAIDEALQPDNAWRATAIDDLDDLTPAILESLRAGDIATLGGLADFIEQVETGKAKWPKGIGKGKAEKIVNSLILWQDNNGAGVDAVDSRDVPVTEVSAVYPTAEEWATWSNSKQTRWLEDRAEVLATGDVATPELMKTVQWEQGFDAHDDGMKIENCELLPGEECDAWLCGWLRAKDQSEE
jgi:hypothetical protein